MWDSGFIMPTVCATHFAAGVLLLFNRWVPLALALHLPVTIQMNLLHLFLDPKTGGIAYLVLGLNAFLLWVYRQSFAGLLNSQIVPTPEDLASTAQTD